jgi:Helicase HerA, central domain
MDFLLGGDIGPDGGRTGDRTTYRASDLTTHGVIVGMTGSGKTGLGIILLEEALRNGLPCLVIDPKGDMTNLLLTFPDLAPEDFLPWIDAASAARDGRSPEEEAAAQAGLWRDGLAAWDLHGTDIAALRDAADMTIYTPGSTAGVPLDVVGDLSAPSVPWAEAEEVLRDEIQGFVSGLLGLVDVDADPLSSREHILLSNLIEHAWSAGRDLTLQGLITQIVSPPMRKLGVFDIETFFPEKDRTSLAMRLNGLLASPSFASWMDGEPVDIESLLWRDGRPRAAIVYLAHLTDVERQFIVTTILAKLITWMRSQAGSSDLRAVAYMDEVFGFAPPTAQPPAKKPILTLLKQARAFGVGLVLSTQNPVDLDYKAMSNAGTWWIGRLQTERDKARILEGLSAASGAVDVDEIDARISGLDKRQFVLHSTHSTEPGLFTTRWAMSYLRGPMTRDEVGSITGDARHERAPGPSSAPEEPTEPTFDPYPPTPSTITVVALDPAAPWADVVGFDADGDHAEPIVAVTVEMRFDEARAGIDVTERWEAVATTLDRDPERMEFIEVDHDPRDFVPVESDLGVRTPDAPIDQARWYDDIGRAIRDRLDRTAELTVLRNPTVDLVSRPGESRESFTTRCAQAAGDAADREMAELRDRYATRLARAERAYEDAVRGADTAAAEVDEVQRDTVLGAGLDLLMGRKPRISTSSGRSAGTRLRKAEDRVERARGAYEDLGDELQRDLATIEDRWRDAADDIEPLTIGLESDDIRVLDVRLVWVRR